MLCGSPPGDSAVRSRQPGGVGAEGREGLPDGMRTATRAGTRPPGGSRQGRRPVRGPDSGVCPTWARADAGSRAEGWGPAQNRRGRPATLGRSGRRPPIPRPLRRARARCRAGRPGSPRYRPRSLAAPVATAATAAGCPQPLLLRQPLLLLLPPPPLRLRRSHSRCGDYCSAR